MGIISIILLSITGSKRDIDLNFAYIKSYPVDAKAILSEPFHWDEKDWIKASGIMGVGTVLYLNDNRIQDWAQGKRNYLSNNISKYATYFGEKQVVAPSLLLYYLYGRIFHNQRAKNTALLGLEGFILSGIFTNIVKYSAHRSRPYTGYGAKHWDGPSFSLSDDYLSFPSGHSTTAFALATIFSNEYKSVFSSLLFYSLATLTAISRVNDNVHWTSDVFFGAVIGYATSKALLSLHSQKNNRFGVSPYINGKSIGMMVQLR